jgi:hypothetical protein
LTENHACLRISFAAELFAIGRGWQAACASDVLDKWRVRLEKIRYAELASLLLIIKHVDHLPRFHPFFQ